LCLPTGCDVVLVIRCSVQTCYPDAPLRVTKRLEGVGARKAEDSGSTAGLAGFEPATHGPGNRCHSSVIPSNPCLYAVSAASLVYITTTIDCHRLSDKLSIQLLRGVILYATHTIHRRIERVVRTITPFLSFSRRGDREPQRFLEDRLVAHFFYPKDGTRGGHQRSLRLQRQLRGV
jgi:hypothetical protein